MTRSASCGPTKKSYLSRAFCLLSLQGRMKVRVLIQRVFCGRFKILPPLRSLRELTALQTMTGMNQFSLPLAPPICHPARSAMKNSTILPHLIQSLRITLSRGSHSFKRIDSNEVTSTAGNTRSCKKNLTERTVLIPLKQVPDSARMIADVTGRLSRQMAKKSLSLWLGVPHGRIRNSSRSGDALSALATESNSGEASAVPDASA